MYERINKCPSCNGDQFKNNIICNDYLVSNESFVIVQCDSCNLRFTNPRPKAESLGEFYKSDQYISHSQSISSLTDIAYRIARSFNLKSKLALINKLTPQGRLLDYGCGTGAFINTCKKNGWTVSGVELDDDARNIAQTHTHTTIVPSYEQLDNNIKFDIISLWHVLEHVSNLNETIVELKHKMVKKGRLIVAVPNHDSLDQQIYKQHWAAYDLPRHLYHFNQKTIKAIMKRHQLKLIETHPMKMDAYYVSLLSEQHLKADHKSKGNMFVNAIINGYKSNTYAKNNQNNYSSLIYVFEK